MKFSSKKIIFHFIMYNSTCIFEFENKICNFQCRLFFKCAPNHNLEGIFKLDFIIKNIFF